MSTFLRRGFARAVILYVLALLFTPSLAHAKWLRAESNHFIVYSEGDERSLRTYAETLEVFDTVLRRLHGLSSIPSERKLPIYLVRSERDLRIVADLPSGARGFYTASSEDIFAVAVSRGRHDDFVLHEYVHHFMLANFPYAYPAWLVEGYAEYFMTFTVDENFITWGQYNENRAAWLVGAKWIPVSTLISKHSAQLRSQEEVAQFYAQGWALTHYFMSTPQRRAQLDAYLKAIGAGEDSLAAMQSATGVNADELHRTLRGYVKGKLAYARVPPDQFPPGPVSITQLPASADDLLLLAQRLKVGARGDNKRAAFAEKVRRAAARHPGDPFAMVALGHAELHFGDPAAGERVLLDLLKREPAHVEALQLMATARLRAATKSGSPAEAKTLRGQARGFLARAYKADPLSYQTLYLLALSREPEADYPTDNDVATWLAAYDQAPQLAMVRLGGARALMFKGEFDRAGRMLGPLANNPHGGTLAAAAQALVARAKEGKPPLPEVTADDDQGVDVDTGPVPEPDPPKMWMQRPAGLFNRETVREGW